MPQINFSQYSKIGEIAALVTAFSWAAGAMIFESAIRRAGVMAVNTLKVIFATAYLAVLAFLITGNFLPVVPVHCWIYMSASGLMGFVIGDYFLFTGYKLIGSRLSMLFMSLSVPLTAVLSWILFQEALGRWSILGILATLGGISLTILAGNKPPTDGAHHQEIQPGGYRKGVVFGILSAAAMAAATLLTKVGAADVPPIAATQVRVFSAAVGFILVAVVSNQTNEIITRTKDRRTLLLITGGSFFGPFVGVGCLLFAIQKAPAGIVSTIVSLSPVLIIPASMVVWKRKVRFLEILGALIAFTGIALLFL